MNYRHLNLILGIMLTILFIMVAYAYADAPIQACTQADGSILYTNKNVKGCTVLKTPELSIVPSYDTHPGIERTPEQVRGVSESPTYQKSKPVNEVVTKTCALYKEWIMINERTKGGFEYNDVEDTKHRLYLTKIFGSGFSPSMCKED